MVFQGAAIYGGLSDTVEVMAWLEDDEGNELYKQLSSLLIELMHSDTVMLQTTATEEHYTKDFNEEKGCFRAFFLHPPIQHHQYVRLTATLKNGDSARLKTNVLTEMMLARLGKELTNPAFGGRLPTRYPMPIEEEQK